MQKKSLETILYSTAGVIIMAAILFGFNVITGAAPKRVDLTGGAGYVNAYTPTSPNHVLLPPAESHPLRPRGRCTIFWKIRSCSNPTRRLPLSPFSRCRRRWVT